MCIVPRRSIRWSFRCQPRLHHFAHTPRAYERTDRSDENRGTRPSCRERGRGRREEAISCTKESSLQARAHPTTNATKMRGRERESGMEKQPACISPLLLLTFHVHAIKVKACALALSHPSQPFVLGRPHAHSGRRRRRWSRSRGRGRDRGGSGGRGCSSHSSRICRSS